MQHRTQSILKWCAVIAGICACLSVVIFTYASLGEFDRLSEIRLSDGLSILGVALIGFALTFTAVFLMCGLFALLLVGIAQYVYDRIYRTPTL